MTYTSSSKLLCTRTSSGSKMAKNPFVRLSTVSVPNRAKGSILPPVVVADVGVVEGVVPAFSAVAMFYMRTVTHYLTIHLQYGGHLLGLTCHLPTMLHFALGAVPQ